MAGEIKVLKFVDGVSVAAPAVGDPSGGLVEGQLTVRTTSDNKIFLDDDGGGANTVALQTNGATNKFVIEKTGTGDNLFEVDLDGTAPGVFPAGVAFKKTGTGTDAVDWFEAETSWTPTIRGEGGLFSPLPTYVTQQGSYIRIGKMVFYSYRVEWSAASGGSGALVIAGLPYNPNGSNFMSAMSYSNLDLAGTDVREVSMQPISGTDRLRPRTMGDGISDATINVSVATSGSFNKEMRGSGFYFVS